MAARRSLFQQSIQRALAEDSTATVVALARLPAFRAPAVPVQFFEDSAQRAMFEVECENRADFLGFRKLGPGTAADPRISISLHTDEVPERDTKSRHSS